MLNIEHASFAHKIFYSFIIFFMYILKLFFIFCHFRFVVRMLVINSQALCLLKARIVLARRNDKKSICGIMNCRKTGKLSPKLNLKQFKRASPLEGSCGMACIDLISALPEANLIIICRK